MQITMTLEKPMITLPINYRVLIHGMIYRALSSDAAYSLDVHEGRLVRESRAYKGFTFSPLMGAYTMRERIICFHRQAVLEMRCWDEKMALLLHAYFSTVNEVALGSEKLRVTRCVLENKKIDATEASIRMISPVVAYMTDETRHTVFFKPDEDRFYAALLRNAERKNSLFQPEVPFDLQIRPLNSGMPRRQFSRFKSTYINAWFGNYQLTGAPQVINLLYQAGLGAKNSEGFGLFAALPSSNF